MSKDVNSEKVIVTLRLETEDGKKVEEKFEDSAGNIAWALDKAQWLSDEILATLGYDLT